ncbi:MAG: N-acetylmuramoyl-L-alanine amidase [Rhizobiaceae bacterium]
MLSCAFNILRLVRVTILAFALVCLTAAVEMESDGARASGSNQLPIAFAARVVGDESRGRLIVDFDQAVDHDVYLKNDPMRIVVDLSQTIFNLGKDAKSLKRSLISNFRFGDIEEGRSKIVLELARPAEIESHRLKKLASGNRHRLFVDFKTASKQAFAKLVRKEDKVRPRKIVRNRAKLRNRYTIVLDPGHGGVDGGASGVKRTVEKNVTLHFAKLLKERLSQNNNFDVLMTRDDDSFLGLADRVKFARESKADLLLSIHADSLAQRRIRGATVYSLSEEGSDDISRSLAKKQNRTDLIAGLELPKTKPRVFDILIDMTRRETEVFSKQFAHILVQRLKQDIRLIRNPHRSADFYVLKAPEVPSILLELGYLSNREDEELMRSSEWQNLAVLRTYEAILAFFETRLGQK